MSNSQPPNMDHWTKWVLLVAAAILPAVVVNFIQAIAHDPWWTAIYIIICEIVLLVIAFTTKIWKRFEEKLIDDIVNGINSFIPRHFPPYYERYYEFFSYNHNNLDLRGITSKRSYPIKLEKVFVKPQVRVIVHQAATSPLLQIEQQSGEKGYIQDYLSKKQHDHFLILGAPGSGKTTLLQHLALNSLQPKKKFRPQNLPVLILLREHTQAIKDSAKSTAPLTYTYTYTLEEAIRAQVRNWRKPIPNGWIEHLVDKGKCLILLDGLDEVADTETHQMVVGWVEEQITKFGDKNRFIITSRPYIYPSNSLSNVTVLEILPLSKEQIEQFVKKWCDFNEYKAALLNDDKEEVIQERADNKAHEMLRRLKEKPDLLHLATNPLLLTMIAIIYYYDGSLPGARFTLYKEICEAFLGKRQEARGVEQEMSADERQRILQTLAYDMLLKNTYTVSEEDAQDTIEDILIQTNEDGASQKALLSNGQDTSTQVKKNVTPKEFLQSIENRSGLLLERDGVYMFAHQTFQEYLAAMHIREKGLEQELIKQVKVGQWHETIRLYCTQADATEIVKACLDDTSPSIEILYLAHECAYNNNKIDTSVKNRLETTIAQGLEDDDSHYRHIVSEAVLTYRLLHMQPVGRNTYTNTSSVEQTEYQLFLHEQMEKVYTDTSLVKCAEYQLFLDEQVDKGKYYRPLHWRKGFFTRGEGQEPMLGVAYKDALAFCQWLTERDLTGVWYYRLPRPDETVYVSEIASTIKKDRIAYWSDSAEPALICLNEDFFEEQEERVYNILLDGLRNNKNQSFLDSIDKVDAKNQLAIEQIAQDATRRFHDLQSVELQDLQGCKACIENFLRILDQRFTKNLKLEESDRQNLVSHHELARNLIGTLSESVKRLQDLNYPRSTFINGSMQFQDYNNITDASRSLVVYTYKLYSSCPSRQQRLKLLLHQLYFITVDFFMLLYLFQARYKGVFPAYEGILLMKERK